ncbi:AraC family transcriptional regulator [Bacillus inaquosorum]|uniref:AraC family transcriptional regulator n=1 Tax=Bacillus inaquosorum TaxID=483913 RepID=UPI00227F8C61|nr:AraC family transcriptional regulator [Bacillus inaquosorum]MCY8281000.1 AraC family transcriptional regulator [Bacillus inaquosorum]MCY8752554.1 AraC family transcriptional regulator [Bacillus inaquosorum]MCY9342347.1 AraC family transcriptional regulator [Bacillus inaquosorum]MEC0680871.1 AraC family transcriptional regulator [Bacillus inaquosorum]
MKSFMIDQNLKELTEHRTVELPVACYETRINQNINGYIPLHWHDEIQFVLIRKGEAVFQINEEKIVIPEGDGLFINSSCLHMAEEKDGSDCTYICLNVSPHFVLSQELFSSYVQPYIFSTNLSFLFLDGNQHWAKNILKAVKKINQLVQQKTSLYEIDITIQLILIWKNLVFNGFQLEYEQSEMIKSYRMKQMLNWIHLHYAEKITLEDIAKAGQLSRSECCRYFKRMLNKTPLRYVLDYRIQKSLLLLQHPETNVTEVSYQVGFNSTSYFISKFQQVMNMTPFSYKKIHMGIN